MVSLDGKTVDRIFILAFVNILGEIAMRVLCGECVNHHIVLLGDKPHRVITRHTEEGRCTQCGRLTIELKNQLVEFYREEMEHGKR